MKEPQEEVEGVEEGPDDVVVEFTDVLPPANVEVSEDVRLDDGHGGTEK